MTAGFILTVFWAAVIFFIAKAPKEFMMILLVVGWMIPILAIIYTLIKYGWIALFGD
jgi:hypothetical protein